MTVDGAIVGRRIAAVAGAAALVLAGAGCANRGQSPAPPILAAPAGSAGLLATTQGPVWSFQRDGRGYGVLRSPDKGQNWQVALPERGTDSDLVAGYFFGPGTAWVVDRQRVPGGLARTTVLGTSDGGTTWRHSGPLPGDTTGPEFRPRDQIYFSDAEHGWLLAAGTRVGPPSAGPLPDNSEQLQLWRTSDAGRTWTVLPGRGLPLQGMPLAGAGRARCADQPAITFANPVDGWLVQGSCGSGDARPVVWRTTDGGRRWNPAPLPAPAGGFGRWAGILAARSTGRTTGVDVGQARVVASGIQATVLVPVSVRRSGIVIERSTDGGRHWHIAASVRTGTLPDGPTPSWWFDPIDAADWVISAPGRLLETEDAGRHWTVTRSVLSVPGAPASFVNVDHGYVQGTGLVAAFRTAEHGKAWTAEQAPAWSGTSPMVVGSAISAVQVVTRHLAVAAGAAGLETSADGGRSWTVRVSVPGPVRQVDFTGPRVGFAVAAGELLRSRDGGVTWYPIGQPVAGPVRDVGFWSARAGVASLATASGYYVTRDGGRRWTPLRLPAGWTAHKGGMADQRGSRTAAACFATGGIGWMAASRDGRTAVLVTADGGRHWRVALWPRAIGEYAPQSARAGLAGCDGRTAWVAVTHIEPGRDGLSYDLLRTADFGRTWLDVLRTAAARSAARPAVALSPGGLAPSWASKGARFGALALGHAGSAFSTFTGRGGHGLGVGATSDPGWGWSWHWFADPANHSKLSRRLPASARWLATCALSSRRAWVLLAGPSRSGASYLYATADGGTTWHLVTVFRRA